jgi:hypothetical protein
MASVLKAITTLISSLKKAPPGKIIRALFHVSKNFKLYYAFDTNLKMVSLMQYKK